VRQADLELLVPLELRDPQELQALAVPWERPAQLVHRVHLEQPVRLDPLGQMVLQDHLEVVDCQV